MQWTPTEGSRHGVLMNVFVVLLLVQQMAAVEEEDDYYDDYEPDEDEEIVASREKRGGETNEYYDFITNEYSYKLWAAFMIYDMITVFYACLVSAYFGEVNTITPSPAYDYDYLIKRSDESVIKAPPTHLQKAF